MTPVQKLNREGVDAVRKQQYEKAEAIFYKAYLYDPSDPFTLNNLGYISELQGQLDRAQKFYALASEQGGDAFIDRSNSKELQGKSMSYALSSLKDVPMRVNRMNVQAMELLSEGHNDEAEHLLQQALTLDPQNTFTQNNLGVAEEALGDYESALKYYDDAAEAHSSEPVVVTLNRAWRGKPVSEMAADSARQLQDRMRKLDTAEARAAMLTVRGVSAANRNDWTAARQDFLQAYSLDPSNAFSLNNLGYVSEKDGDLETAQFFYTKAEDASDANARVGLATQPLAEGQHLVEVATDSDQKIDGELQSKQARRRQAGPAMLNRRVKEPPADQKTPPAPSPAPANSVPPTPHSN
jgi:Flp pilus assembly protein TadD